MKLLDLTIEHLSGVLDRTYLFGDGDGAPRDVVVLTGDAPVALLEIIASLLETVRRPCPAPHRLAWWAKWRGPGEARLSARWALTEGEAARAGLAAPTAVTEWRFGPGDRLPREVLVEGALPQCVRGDLGRHVHVDVSEIDVWMEADPLAELLAGIARRDVAATRVACRPCAGIVGYHTPDTFAAITQAIAPVFPALRLERVSPARGEVPVACFREGERVELDQLPDAERDAIHLATRVTTARVRNGVVLVGRPELHVPRDAHRRWVAWLAGLVPSNQLLVAPATSRASRRAQGASR
jgi:hypothetical protein